MKPLLVSIPHSGEQIVPETPWLHDLEEVILMYDVDRFIDQMYQGVLEDYNIPFVKTPYHRYVVDCNRWPSDVDVDSVEGNENPSNSHPTGLHWRKTTSGYLLFKEPLKKELHEKLLEKYYTGFFKNIDAIYEKWPNKKNIYHLDLHSMPSRGTKAHRDPNEDRADIVIGNEKGSTATSQWTNQVTRAYEKQGFSVKLNHPYTGGTIVEKYGDPKKGRQALMIELNRKLYMDQNTKQIIPEKAKEVKVRLRKVISDIYAHLPE